MIATYRLQLQPDFDFADVERLVPYFKELGISHLYLSPITEAEPGSTHGYNVVDHNAVREDLGGREGFDRLLEAAQEEGLKLILDFVPNHAGVGSHNASWQDVLAYGQHSTHANYFDIDWSPLKPELQGKILLPFLGQPYGEALDEGEITLSYDDGRFYATYYDNHFALSPLTYAHLLEQALPRYERSTPYWDLKDLVEAYRNLEPSEPAKAEALRPRLKTLGERIDLDELAGEVDREALHELLEQQYWRLAYWKTASYEVNYRRFFSINSLVALRMEDAHVFWDAHRLLGELLTEEGVDGVRIDHIDGLFDPHEYLSRLRELGAGRIWVEKILAPGETLPEDWPVEGATGYAFMSDAMHLLLQPEGLLPLSRTYQRFVPDATTYDEEVYQSKKLVIETTLTSELARLAYELDRLSEADYHTRDFTLEALREALVEIVAAFDRYRTYLPQEDGEEVRAIIRAAVHRAQQRNPAAEPTVFEFIGRVILGDVREDLQDDQRAWTARFQQYTAPVAAKGVEDTAFYRYLRLAALNEVGGEPGDVESSTHGFHARARFRARRYPENLLATATHDHKRGEDTRMRMIALTEVPDLWDETVHALDEIGTAHRGARGPSRRDAYLFYQTLAALWPERDPETFADRLWTYMQKASRESKLRTSWINPDEAYEEDLEAFVRGVIEDERTPETIEELAETLARRGFRNSLSQLILKMTVPGVPDIYQGCEMMDLSLVDPDNRRPVDYERRQRLLQELGPMLETPDAQALREMIEAQDETAKLYLTAHLLQLRRDHEALFAEGGYQALETEDGASENWTAFVRGDEEEEAALLTVVPRLIESWEDPPEAAFSLPEALAGSTWQDALTGESVEAGETLCTKALPLPWAVLLRS